MIRRSVVLVAMLGFAGATLAQEPAPPPPQWNGDHDGRNAAEWRQKMEQRRVEQLDVLLDLTPAQRQQVQVIFAEEHAKMRTAMQQVEQAMKQARVAHEAAHKETLQRLSSVLSPTQMKKLKVLMPEHGFRHGMMHGMMMHGMMMHDMEHGMRGPSSSAGPGPGPGPQ
ncbi:MAG TPA: hypothetical protein VN735_13760 [Steroidobacteraceae bacterium]|nr:hypothetical protein [Steroidobacteraceae bacterium]